MAADGRTQRAADHAFRRGTLRALLFTLGLAGLRALFGMIGIIFSTPLTVVVIILIQALYLHDVLGEEVALLGKQEQS